MIKLRDCNRLIITVTSIYLKGAFACEGIRIEEIDLAGIEQVNDAFLFTLLQRMMNSGETISVTLSIYLKNVHSFKMFAPMNIFS